MTAPVFVRFFANPDERIRYFYLPVAILDLFLVIFESLSRPFCRSFRSHSKPSSTFSIHNPKFLCSIAPHLMLLPLTSNFAPAIPQLSPTLSRFDSNHYCSVHGERVVLNSFLVFAYIKNLAIASVRFCDRLR